MFITIQAYEYDRYSCLLDQFFLLRKEVFHDRLNWKVSLRGAHEVDRYDDMKPAYLVWCSEDGKVLYGGMRLMPTTGPTLLYDVFRKTFSADVDLQSPGIWEGTRMCVDEVAVQRDLGMDGGRAFCMLLLALCECAMEHGVHTMISNYEPHMVRMYRKAGAEVQELGRADGYGRFPVCCGAFEVSPQIRAKMQAALGVTAPLYSKFYPVRSFAAGLAVAA